MDGIVRPMEYRDVEAVALLEKNCFSDPWSEHLLQSGLESSLDSYLVWEEQKEIRGYCVLRTLADEGEIQRIAVDQNWRRRGIGRRLMESMVSLARMKGVREIALEVRAGNQGARKLYESYGFRQEALRKGYYRNPQEDALIMWNRCI